MQPLGASAMAYIIIDFNERVRRMKNLSQVAEVLGMIASRRPRPQLPQDNMLAIPPCYVGVRVRPYDLCATNLSLEVRP